MLKLPCNCTHLTHQKSNPQNSPSQALTVHVKQYMFKLVLEKAEEPEIKFVNIRWIIEKARKFQKNIYFCFIGYAKAFDCVDHNKLENSERDGKTRPPDLPPEKSV